MKLHLLFVTPSSQKVFYFTDNDAQLIIQQCMHAGKKWAEQLVGFTINSATPDAYAAINVKSNDKLIDSMEYRHMESGKSEFELNQDWLTMLAAKDDNSFIAIEDFKLLAEILIAPIQARKWQAYEVVNQRFVSTH